MGTNRAVKIPTLFVAKSLGSQARGVRGVGIHKPPPVYTPTSGSFNYRLWRIGLTHGRRMRSWENVKGLIWIWDNHGEEVDDDVPAKHEIVYLVNPPLPPEKVGLTENCQRSNFSKLLINANSIHKSRFFLSQDEQHWVTLCIGMPGHKVINRLRATSQETNN